MVNQLTKCLNTAKSVLVNQCELAPAHGCLLFIIYQGLESLAFRHSFMRINSCLGRRLLELPEENFC